MAPTLSRDTRARSRRSGVLIFILFGMFFFFILGLALFAAWGMSGARGGEGTAVESVGRGLRALLPKVRRALARVPFHSHHDRCPPAAAAATALAAPALGAAPVSGVAPLVALGFMRDALPRERFTLDVYVHTAEIRPEHLCVGERCVGTAFSIVDQRRESSDSILEWLLAESRAEIEAFNMLLNSDNCVEMIARSWTRETPEAVGHTPRCAHMLPPGEWPPVVVDLGANSGFYSLFSAASGAQVVAVDAQPHCAQYLRAGALLSELSDRVDVRTAFVMNAEATRVAGGQSTHSVAVRSGCWGTYPRTVAPQIEGAAKEYGALPGGDAMTTVPVVNAVDLLKGIGRRILVLKIDVEGTEPGIVDELFTR